MKAYLKIASVNDGQSSNKKSVAIENCSGDIVSGFFENEYIRDNKLEVNIIYEKDELVLVKLPGTTLELSGSNQGYMSVKKEDLEFL